MIATVQRVEDLAGFECEFVSIVTSAFSWAKRHRVLTGHM